MGMAPSEPSIYDKLSESIDVLRQSGHRFGMSEKEIEKFILEVLETNVPRRDPPRFPILIAASKLFFILAFLLLTVLAFLYPQSSLQYGLPGHHSYNWSSPISHVRLLSLPIAKKYNLQEFHEWWSSSKKSHSEVPVNCSGCASVSAIHELTEKEGKLDCIIQGSQPVLFKGGQALSLTYEDMEQLYSKRNESMDLFVNENSSVVVVAETFPKEPVNFTIFWKTQLLNPTEVLQLLFPHADLRHFLNQEAVSIKRCLVLDGQEPNSQVLHIHRWLVIGKGFPSLKFLPHSGCYRQCRSFYVWLAPGDLVFADSRLWQMELFPSRGQNIVCDGSGF
ncbi:bombesin receptor-activated protein C6orf89 homolog [Erpetoichthys calabaricus]|nr:bombesin receptor-activated protein C6orf89 homolog [Erpetoichthys calabaricus]